MEALTDWLKMIFKVKPIFKNIKTVSKMFRSEPTCVNSCGPDDGDVPPDVEVVLEDVDDSDLEGLARLRMLAHDAVQDQVVLLVLLELVHLFLAKTKT